MIHQIALNDCLDGTAPPERVLVISALDDTAFVRICKVSQDAHTEKLTDEGDDISVSLASLIEALNLLAGDQEREHLRPADSTQARETRLAGARLTMAATAPGSAVAALTTHLRYTAPPKPGKAGDEESSD
jgi:hypothetical protein